MGQSRGGVDGKTGGSGTKPAEVKADVLTTVLPPAVELPPSPIVQPPPEPTEVPPDPAVVAQDYIFSIYLHLEAVACDLNKLLLSEKGPRFRQAAAERKTPVGGDGRQWPPLNAMLRVVLDMNPLGE